MDQAGRSRCEARSLRLGTSTRDRTGGRHDTMKLEGRVALVTGGGGGMGGAQCRLFAAEGAAVCVTDIFPEKAQAVADEIEKAGGKAIARRLEVQKAEEWAE